MKDSYYFPHDYHARHDPKLEKLRMKMGCEGVGIFWCLVEMLYEENGYLEISELDIYSKSLNAENSKILEVIENYGLFTVNEGRFYSDTLLKRLEHLTLKREKAKESAISRWSANAMRTHSDGNAIKESKVKESIIPMFNEFYSKYPKKKGKEQAFKAFVKLSPNNELFRIILSAVDIQSKTDQWKKDNGQFVPMPATWINGKRWEDEVKKIPQWIKP